MTSRRATLLLLGPHLGLALGLAACAAGPGYRPPPPDLPPAYRHAPDAEAAARPGAWWRSFDDPQLDALEAAAMAQNLTLAQAAARLDQSRARAAAAGAARRPAGQATLQATHARQSLASNAGRIIAVFPEVERSGETYDAGLGASWELDLFGGLGRTSEAARAELQAAGADVAAARLAVSADVADAYIELRFLQQRLALLDRQIALLGEREALVRLRVGRGAAAGPDLDAVTAEEALRRAERPAAAAALDATFDRLAILLGRSPESDRGGLAATGDVPRAGGQVTGLPSDLLRRRPDLMAAERRLAAANARIGAAVAEYYPRIGVQALLGVESLDPGDLLTSRAVSSQSLLGLRWRLFDFGRIGAEVAAARGREAEALAAYRETVLRASADVELALVQREQAAEQGSRLAEGARSLAKRREATAAALTAGAATRLDLSQADLQVLDVETDLLLVKARLALADVALARATGGAVEGGSPPAPAVRSRSRPE